MTAGAGSTTCGDDGKVGVIPDISQTNCHPDPFDFAQDKDPRRICAQLDDVRD
jgi:hypothetical protein